MTDNKTQQIGTVMPDWSTATQPIAAAICGNYCDLQPLVIEWHGEALYDAFSDDAEGENWTYLPAQPPQNITDFKRWLAVTCRSSDPLFYAVVDKKNKTAIGMMSLMRIDAGNGVIEVGHIHFSAKLQKTPLATEAMYLLMRQIFDWGYRRYEWKCDNLNAPSKKAAQRLGFSFEGIFRQAVVYKGRNRDTAWFSILDSEWPKQQGAFERWLEVGNFDDEGMQRQSLSEFNQ